MKTYFGKKTLNGGKQLIEHIQTVFYFILNLIHVIHHPVLHTHNPLQFFDLVPSATTHPCSCTHNTGQDLENYLAKPHDTQISKTPAERILSRAKQKFLRANSYKCLQSPLGQEDQSAFYEDKRRGSNLCSHTETLQRRSEQPKSLCWLHLPLHRGYFCTSSWTERERTYTPFPWQHEKIQLSQLTSLITSIYIDSYRCCKR